MTFALQNARHRRAMSLTPMIDVVFLLLVFFMLAARFDQTAVVPITLGSGGSDYTGPPRLLDVAPEAVSLNGVQIPAEALASSVLALTESPADLVILRARGGASVQRLVDVMVLLRAEGLTSVTLVE
ncbi:MAG: biopolymer transporter ExbD [Boseongicola sp.]|nr:biopolymer transporter ExbD [Boseongicola sp.]NNJ68066.1 biopolymer transporter ExbD [Boseongicola sp.]